MTIDHEMEIGDYHRHPSYSKTDLVYAARSPQYVKDMRLNPSLPTAAQAVGSAVHLLLLEPEKAHLLHTIEAGVRRGKEYDQALIEHPEKIILLRKEWDDIEPMVESAKQHGFGKKVIGKGPAEVSFFCDLEVMDMTLPVKCRPDLLPGWGIGGMMAVDVKTARDITPKEFGRAAFNFHYHWSAWLTTKMLEIITGEPHKYYFLCIENHYPHETVVYQAMPWDIELAELELEPVINRLTKAHTTDVWTEIEPIGVIPLSLPKYAFTRRVA